MGATKTRPITLETFSNPQRAFWQDGARFRAFIGGVGSGKTYAGCVEAIRQPQSMGMIVAPTYPMLRDATLRTFLEMLRPLVADFNRSEMRVSLTNGTTVLFRSADDPDRLRGPNLGWFWLDEAALMTPETWLIMIGRLREQPGRAWVTSTPRGKNWLYEVFTSGGDYAMVRSSSRDNPFLPADFVRSLEQAYTSEWLRQEVEGEFVDPAGALFKREWFRVVDRAPEGLFWARYWDLAASTKTSADYTASAAVGFDINDGTLYIRDMVRGRWEWPDARKIIIQTMQSEPGVLHAIEEAMHGLAAIQELRREPAVLGVALRGVKVDKDKLTRALPWAARAEGGKVALVRGQWVGAFLDEVTQFTGAGETHDDQVDTVSGGAELVKRGGNSAVGAFL